MLNPDSVTITSRKNPGPDGLTVYTAEIRRTEQMMVSPYELKRRAGNMESFIKNDLRRRIWGYFYADIMDDFYRLSRIAMMDERYGHEAREICNRMEEKLKPKDL